MSHPLQVNAEAAIRSCSIKQDVLKISQNSQENACGQASGLQLYLKRGGGTGIFYKQLFYKPPAVATFAKIPF